MREQLPLISCLCVTKNSPALLKRAIDCFVSQSYQNKELVVLYELGNEGASSLAMNYRERKDINFIELKPDINRRLGYLRNLAIEAAAGDFFCQWDDDDWYHTERLSMQYDSIKNTRYTASVLSRWVIFDAVNNRAYLSYSRVWEGSLLCKKESVLNKKYKNVSSGEDTDIVHYLYIKKLINLIEVPKLYIYNYHGNNTFSFRHFNGLFRVSFELSPSQSNEIATLLQQPNTIAAGSLQLDKLFSSLVIPKRIHL